MSFEKNLNRLEQIVSQLEGDRLDLNASLALFEEGIELLRKASLELNETESKVKELVERADGVLELPAGTIERTGTAVGDRIALQPAANPE